MMKSTTPTYDLTYSYDQMGNRTSKADLQYDTLTEYTYDIENPEDYESDNNRRVAHLVSGLSI